MAAASGRGMQDSRGGTAHPMRCVPTAFPDTEALPHAPVGRSRPAVRQPDRTSAPLRVADREPKNPTCSTGSSRRREHGCAGAGGSARRHAGPRSRSSNLSRRIAARRDDAAPPPYYRPRFCITRMVTPHPQRIRLTYGRTAQPPVGNQSAQELCITRTRSRRSQRHPRSVHAHQRRSAPRDMAGADLGRRQRTE